MNQKEQQAHATKLEQLEAATTEAIEAINEHLLLAEGRIREQGKSITAVASSEQQGRDLFAKMIDDETQYRKAQVREVEKKMHREALKSEAALYDFMTHLSLWKRLRWIFLGSPYAIPPQIRKNTDDRLQTARQEIIANRKAYYGEKPR